MEVFKLQRSVLPLDKVLVYNKNRTYYGEIPITKELEMLFGVNNKVYVKGTLTRYGFLEIEEVIETPHPYW